MKGFGRLLLFAIFIALIGGIYVWKNFNSASEEGTAPDGEENLPRMVQVSSPTCPPCLLMVPTINGLQKEYKGKVVIEEIDIAGNTEASEKYQIRATPTQIFFDSEGEEFWRHEGFMSKKEIVRVFEEIGVGR